jgi:type IV pilus assembly protein PilV
MTLTIQGLHLISEVIHLFVPRKYFVASEGGFTLIEALIAFVILSVGLLGIVSLQAIAKTSQHLAIQHTRAVTLADAIVERIRVNPTAMATYNIGLSPVGDGTRSPQDCSTACTPTQLANHDLWAWDQALAGAVATIDAGATNTAGLIQPRGCIVFTPESGKSGTGRLSVIIQWRGLHESFDAVQTGDTRCGGAAIGADDFRRQVVVNTYVVDEKEF